MVRCKEELDVPVICPVGCDKPVLIRIETQASHAYPPTDKRIAELADGWAFALANMRVRPPDTAAR